MTDTELEQTVQRFITVANAFDTDAVLKLFTEDAVIDDSSVGERFERIAGVKKYFKTYFIAYHTFTKLLSTVVNAPDRVNARVDFTGNFGHETGRLNIRINSKGLITFIEAWLDQ